MFWITVRLNERIIVWRIVQKEVLLTLQEEDPGSIPRSLSTRVIAEQSRNTEHSELVHKKQRESRVEERRWNGKEGKGKRREGRREEKWESKERVHSAELFYGQKKNSSEEVVNFHSTYLSIFRIGYSIYFENHICKIFYLKAILHSIFYSTGKFVLIAEEKQDYF